MQRSDQCSLTIVALWLLHAPIAESVSAAQAEAIEPEGAFVRYEIEDEKNRGLLTRARVAWSDSTAFATVGARLNHIAEQDNALGELANSFGPDGFGPMQIINTEDELGPLLEIDQDPRLLHAGPEAMIETSQILPVSFLTNGALVQRAVGRISATQPMTDPVTMSSVEPGDGIATGFKIGPRLLMTNAHVVRAEDLAATMTVWFNYQCATPSCDINVEIWRLEPSFFWYINNDLDIAIVGIAEHPENGLEPQIEIAPIEFKPHPTYSYVEGMEVNVIQHPGGKLKKIALHDNHIVDFRQRANASRFRYTSDTLPGSSGSPLFDNSWQLIGIHRASGTEIAGRYLNNEGIRIDKVVEHLGSLETISGRSLDEFQIMLGSAPGVVSAAVESGQPDFDELTRSGRRQPGSLAAGKPTQTE